MCNSVWVFPKNEESIFEKRSVWFYGPMELIVFEIFAVSFFENASIWFALSNEAKKVSLIMISMNASCPFLKKKISKQSQRIK